MYLFPCVLLLTNAAISSGLRLNHEPDLQTEDCFAKAWSNSSRGDVEYRANAPTPGGLRLDFRTCCKNCDGKHVALIDGSVPATPENKPTRILHPDLHYTEEAFDCSDDVANRYNPSHEPVSGSSWKSQESEDKWLYQHFFHSARGANFTMVEIGALDGIQYSNSYAFEKELGWRTVLIEASLNNYQKLVENRPESTSLFAGSCEEPRLLNVHGEGPMANGNDRAHGTLESYCPCLPMSVLHNITNVAQIDLFSIDVEGAEYELLSSHDFEKVPVHTILIEMRKVDEATNQKERKLLQANGFCRFASNVGHSNEVWVNPRYVPKQ